MIAARSVAETPVVNRYYKRINGVGRYGAKQNIRNDVDKDVSGKKFGIKIELPLGHFRW
jgi:hypothetical protein